MRDFIYGKPPAEQLQEWQRSLKKEQRQLDKEIRDVRSALLRLSVMLRVARGYDSDLGNLVLSGPPLIRPHPSSRRPVRSRLPSRRRGPSSSSSPNATTSSRPGCSRARSSGLTSRSTGCTSPRLGLTRSACSSRISRVRPSLALALSTYRG